MPNRYSHSSVIVDYCQSGFISLPEELYLAYIRASSIPSLSSRTQPSISSRNSSSENDPEQHRRLSGRRNFSLPSAGDLAHQGERGRARNPMDRTPISLSHKPNPQDRAALIHSFLHDIDNEPQPHVTHQSHLRSNVDIGHRSESQKRHGVFIEEASCDEPRLDIKWSRSGDRDGPKLTYPPLSHSGTSSASMAVSASSGDYVLDIPSDLPVHVDGTTVMPQQTRTRTQNDEQVDIPVVHDDAIANDPLPEQRSVNRPPFRQELGNDSNVHDTVTKLKLYQASSYHSVTGRTVADRPRSSSRGRHYTHQKANQDKPLPSIPDSVPETGIEVVDNIALSSDYDNGVKIPEHEAAAITRLPSLQPALPAGSIIPPQASPPPAIGSSETRTVETRRRSLDRSESAISSHTQIYAPLSLTFPTDSWYIDHPAFIPESNVVRLGALPESAVERAPETPGTRRQSRGATDELHVPPSNHNDMLRDSSASASESGFVGIPSIQAAVPSRSNIIRSRHTPVYRDRKQKWLQDPAHNVAHFRTLFRKVSPGHKRFAGYTSPKRESSVTHSLNSMPNMILVPKFPEAQEAEDFDLRPVSEASTSASSGFYPPDIPRYRDEIDVSRFASQQRAAELRRGDSGVGVSPSRSTGSLRKKDKAKKAGYGLLRRVSLGGIW